jgi:hypothetical protein
MSADPSVPRSAGFRSSPRRIEGSLVFATIAAESQRLIDEQ